MKKSNFLFFTSLFFASLSYGQEFVKGYVYDDTNGNGKMDKKEIGLAQVSVSNGIEVAQTNDKGYYELPAREDQVIFVIKPTGYQSPLNENNLPQNYYLHKPNGSPADFKYKGVSPTGPLPKLLNFALIKQEENDNFKALIFGDPQPYDEKEIEYFSKGIVSEVVGIKGVAFGLSLGDLVGNDLSLHSPYIKAVKEVGLPWYNLMGNHDMNFDATADSLSDETFEANFGPVNYAFNVGKAHFIVLDDILYPDPRDNKSYWGGFREDQLQFIENDLKYVDKNHLIVLAFHIPLMHQEEDAFRNNDRQRLFDLLKDFPHTLSLSAHTHLQRQNFYTKEDGWQQEKPHHEYNAGTTSGDWYSGELNEQGVPISTMRDGTPKGYAFITFTDNRYTIDYKVAGKPADYQMELFAPKILAQNKRTSAGIYANFFMGAKGDDVQYRVDNGLWKKMEYVEGADPNFLDVLHKYDHSKVLLSGRRPSDPQDCTHLWRGAISTKLTVGIHHIEVKATDRYGKISTKLINYEIAEQVD